jgi:hypothetical protein
MVERIWWFPGNPRSGLSGIQIPYKECPAKPVKMAILFWAPDMRFAHSGE